MFDWDVNKTKVAAVQAKGGPPTPAEVEEENVCPVSPGDVCRAGQEVEPEGPPGQFEQPYSVAVDQASGDVYVQETVFGHSTEKTTVGERVQKFTAEGQLVLGIGREVNQAGVLVSLGAKRCCSFRYAPMGR